MTTFQTLLHIRVAMELKECCTEVWREGGRERVEGGEGRGWRGERGGCGGGGGGGPTIIG